MKNCFKLKNKDKNKPEGKDGENDRHVATTTSGDLIVVSDNDLISVAYDESSWVIDSGAAFHVTSRKDFFTSYTVGEYGVLKMGNDGRSQVVGIGVVVLETKTGMKLVLKNVRHAPDIRLNVISTSVLDDKGYVSTFGDGQCKLTKGSLIVTRGKKCSDRVWSGKEVSYDHLRVFGCKDFVHVPKDERSKLDVKTRQCIFVGYGHDEFGYRLYDPVEKKLVRSRDVIFMEDQNIEDIQKMEKSESQSYDDLVDLNPTPVAHTPNATNEDQNDDSNHVPHDFADGNVKEESNEVHNQPHVDNNAPTVALRSSVLAHEKKLISQDNESEQALKASVNHNSSSGNRGGRGRGRGRGRGSNYQSQNQPNQFQGRGGERGGHHSTNHKSRLVDKSKVECFRCHKYGHYQNECYTNLKGQNGEKSNFAGKEEEVAEEVSLLMACHVKENSHQNMWYLDLGCSNHIFEDKLAKYGSVARKGIRDFNKKWRMPNPRCKSWVNCSCQNDWKPYVSALSSQSCSRLLLNKDQRHRMAVAFSLWPLEFQWIEDIVGEKYVSVNIDENDEGAQEYQSAENDQQIPVSSNIIPDSSTTTGTEHPQRTRRRPAWMADYEVTGDDQGEDPLTHFVLSEDQVANIMTKPLKISAFQRLRKLLGVCESA
ncbi:unnamed protein product [Cuscuta campestris]|uniref:CCHC-type domain-containing protein n=1 Tax=Cuscuta campestris TaxID=132261 RepID=A0A484K7R1_9ASTE|nr:unnamed protein product [Cuscuta campestris]